LPTLRPVCFGVGKLHAARVVGASVLADLGLIANLTTRVDNSSLQLTSSLVLLCDSLALQ
jgi:hypothetical protein